MAVRIEGAALAGISAQWASQFARLTARLLGRTNDDIAIIFVTADKIAKLNAAYRHKKGATDVLSFPSGSPKELGDIFIAPKVAAKKATEKGMAARSYLALLIVHSVLHLGGYDHASPKETAVMNKMENKILKR